MRLGLDELDEFENDEDLQGADIIEGMDSNVSIASCKLTLSPWLTGSNNQIIFAAAHLSTIKSDMTVFLFMERPSLLCTSCASLYLCYSRTNISPCPHPAI
jgi:hypothetical protein